MVASIFNEDQITAIELLAEGGYTYKEVAERANCHVDTLRAWRKKPKFQKAVIDRCRELLKESEPILYNSALKRVKEDGSASHIKILMDRLERIEDVIDGMKQPEQEVVVTWKQE